MIYSIRRFVHRLDLSGSLVKFFPLLDRIGVSKGCRCYNIGNKELNKLIKGYNMTLTGKVVECKKLEYEDNEHNTLYAVSVKEPNGKYADNVYRLVLNREVQEGKDITLQVTARARTYIDKSGQTRATLKMYEMRK